MNTDKRLVINHLKNVSLAKLKKLYEDFGEEEEITRKDKYIEKLTPILLNKIYDKRYEMNISCFSANPGVSRLKEIIPCICHEEIIIPEENLRNLITIFYRTRNQPPQMEIVKIRNLYKFLYGIVTIFTIKRHIYSIDDDFDIWFMLEMHNDKFREFPLVPDWGIMSLFQYNIRFWFKYWFRRYKDEIENESGVDEYEIEIEVDEYQIEHAIEIANEIANESEDEVIEQFSDEVNENKVIEQFSGEVDEEATEVIS